MGIKKVQDTSDKCEQAKVIPISDHAADDSTPIRSKEDTFAYNKDVYGSLIRTWRMKRGINQKELSAMLGFSKNLVCNWEAGRSRPDINLIPKLCEILGISIPAFFGCPANSQELTDQEQTVLRNYRQVGKNNQQLIDTLLDTMITQREAALRKDCEDNFVRVFKNDQAAAAGIGESLDKSSGHYVFVRSDRISCRADEIITVNDDSMAPTFHDDDELFVEYTNEIRPGEIGIFIVNGDGYVKEYQPDGLHSHNPKYKTIHICEGDDVRCVARVLGIVKPDQYPTSNERTVLEEIYRRKHYKKSSL